VIDSCKIGSRLKEYRPTENKTDLGWFSWRIRLNVASCSHKNPECANAYHENPPNRILNWFFELNSLENKMQLESESSNRK